MPLEAIATTPIRCQQVKPDPECEVSVAGGGIQDWSRAGISGSVTKPACCAGETHHQISGYRQSAANGLSRMNRWSVCR